MSQILKWRENNTQFLAVESCKDELKKAVGGCLISEILFERRLANKEYGLNLPEMAIFLSELCEKFIVLCDVLNQQIKE